MASDSKPHGLTVILPDQAQDFSNKWTLLNFMGKTVERLWRNGHLYWCRLIDVSEVTLIDRFGRPGYELYRKAGIITHRSSPIAFVSPLARKNLRKDPK